MTRSLAEMFEYSRWANRTLIEGCRGLDEATLGTRVPGVSGTIASLFAHVIGGEQTQVLRTKGRQDEGELTRASTFPGFDELARLAEETGAALIAIAAQLDDDATAALPWQGRTFRFPVRFFLTHAMEHSVEHRTEIKVALGHLGIETPDLDGWNYAAAMGYGQEG